MQELRKEQAEIKATLKQTEERFRAAQGARRTANAAQVSQMKRDSDRDLLAQVRVAVCLFCWPCVCFAGPGPVSCWPNSRSLTLSQHKNVMQVQPEQDTGTRALLATGMVTDRREEHLKAVISSLSLDKQKVRALVATASVAQTAALSQPFVL